MKKIIAAALLSTAFAAPAFAADSGFYAGVTLGNGTLPNNIGAAALTTKSGGVYGGLVGYQFNQNFGAEAQFTGIGKFQTATFNGKGDAFSLTAVGTFPVSDAISLYGKLGFARTATKVSDFSGVTRGANRTAATYGIGAQYNVNQQIGIRVGYDRYSAAVLSGTATNNFNANVWNAGLVYKF